MADRQPDYNVEQQRLEATIADLELRIARFKLDIIDMESRRRTTVRNWSAAEEAIAEARKNLKALQKSMARWMWIGTL